VRRAIPTLIVIAAAAISSLLWAPFTAELPSSDAALYRTLARNLATGRGYVAPDVVAVSVPQKPSASEVPSTIRAPGYPLFLATFFRLGLGTAWIIAAQVLLFIAAAVIVAFGTRAVTRSPIAGMLAGLIVATYLPAIDCAHQIMTETFFLVVMSGAFFLLWRAQTTPRILLAAPLFAIAPLIRPVAIFLPLIAAGYLLLTTRRWLAVTLFTLIAIAPGALWIARNDRVQGAPIIDGASNENMLFYRAAAVLIVQGRGPVYALTAMHADNDFYYQLVHIRPRLLAMALDDMRRAGIDPARSTYAQRCREYRILGRRIVMQHLGDELLLSISGVLRLFFDQYWDVIATRADYRTARMIGVPLSLLLLGTAIAGARRLWRIERSFVILALVFIAYFVVLTAEPAVEPRGTIPYAPLLAALSASAWTRRRGNSGPS